MENKKIMWYVLAAVAVVLILVGIWYIMSMNKNDDTQAGSTVNTIVPADNGNSNQDNTEQTTQEEQVQEEERISEIQSEREILLAEQARIEAQANATSTIEDPAVLERQQEIEIKLLELKNQEEYPPLADPGV